MESLITQHKKLSLVVGLILAVIIGLNSPVNAAEDIGKTKSSLSQEDQEFFKEYFQRNEEKSSTEQTYIFYTTAGELLYEAVLSKNESIKDEKLQSLLVHSDVIMSFDNISYLVLDES